MIDFNGHVNNLAYLRISNAAATQHWNSATTDEQKNQSLWVVKRHEIDYISEAFENDTLKISTWIEKIEGATCFRCIDVFNPATNKYVCKVKTQWYLLDAVTKKPKRVSADIASLFL
jgi:acyl-CoA thioester hydrolase